MDDDPREPVCGIALCTSVPHRAVLGLVRAAMGYPVGSAVVGDLRASNPQDIVRIATFNYVHVVVASAFDHAPELAQAIPDDLLIYFREMQAGNLRRNAAILEQLRGIGAVLEEEGINGVVLKGGAELLAPAFDNPAFRFLSDLDILVPEAEIDGIVSQFRKRGAIALDISELDLRTHHHAPPLARPDWPVQLELHRRLGQGEWYDFLDPDAVLATARPSGVPGLAVPSPSCRLAHMVQHAQLQPPRYRDGLLSPRDMIEFEIMRRAFDTRDVAAALARFDAGPRAAWEALDASCALVFGDEHSVEELSPSARSWAEQAIAGFGRPTRRRLDALGRWVGWYTKELLTNPERRRQYLNQLRQPGSLRRFFAGHRDRWRRTR